MSKSKAALKAKEKFQKIEMFCKFYCNLVFFFKKKSFNFINVIMKSENRELLFKKKTKTLIIVGRCDV